ncbi:MAG TPA: acylneuraminate cytidylyltransferase family protein [Candidatus Rifleibacterium sp.]|nr:acylneuraminate cytidylyltransferase family protein [Candidatus Rifleibacterium sp.]HPT47524.1 acylneuraminate cytidylyltransferase family protein [Candidatus Rifleibacterium sp.]
MNVIAIIPARGGSKGIPRKNLVSLAGKPLIAHSILHAQQSSLIQRVIVSSEDEEILETARAFGAETPFVRPKALAEDHVLDLPVFQHALHWLKEHEHYQPDIVVHLRPTAPFRKDGWIDEAITSLESNPDADSIRSVSKPDKHPYRMFTIKPDGFLHPIMQHEHPMPYLLRRQDLPDVYFYNCVIDVTRYQTIIEKDSMTGDKIFPYVMNPDEVWDIDSLQDLEIGKILFSGLLK